jgi:hypothetical protein
MKKLILFTAIFLAGTILKAQETFFPIKVGTVLIYKSFDKKDKLTGTNKYTIKDVKISGSNVDLTYQCESMDAKDKLLFKEDITIHQKGDILYMDMSNFINKAAFQQNGEIPAELEVKGNNMEIPVNPKPGDKLADANVEMSMKMGFVSMKMTADVTNRKVEAIEDITVKCGTYKCYKFSCDVVSIAMGIKVTGKSVSWYAKGIGTVKSESYDKDGKLLSRMELVEVKG